MLKIAIVKSIPYIKGLLEDKFIVKYLSDEDFTNDNIKDCDAIVIRSTTLCDSKLLRGTNVKFISTATAGFDHIDTDYCHKNNIIWQNCEGCNKISVVQYVLSSLSYLLLEGGKQLKDIKLGIVGVGNTGGMLFKAARIIGIDTMICDPILEEKGVNKGICFSSLEELYKQCDVISLHVPLTKDGKYPTYHIINKKLLSSSNKKPIIINACRGGVVNSIDLIDAYNNNIVSYVITDCWENEPNINKEHLNISFIATPHIAGFSADAKRKATIMSCNNILSWSGLKNIDESNIELLEPHNQIIDIGNTPEYMQLEKVIISTTNISCVSKYFKGSPQKFKKIRKEYERPREFSAYSVTNASENNNEVLRELGFTIN